MFFRTNAISKCQKLVISFLGALIFQGGTTIKRSLMNVIPYVGEHIPWPCLHEPATLWTPSIVLHSPLRVCRVAISKLSLSFFDLSLPTFDTVVLLGLVISLLNSCSNNRRCLLVKVPNSWGSGIGLSNISGSLPVPYVHSLTLRSKCSSP